MSTDQIQQQIQTSFDTLKLAIKNRKYDQIQPVLDEQRELLNKLHFREAGELELLKQAQDVTNWALTLARIQHAHDERAYACMLRLKQLDQGYMPSPVCSADFVSCQG